MFVLYTKNQYDKLVNREFVYTTEKPSGCKREYRASKGECHNVLLRLASILYKD
jgi:hypothetical protein